jgi:hypothetical protein
MHCLRDSPVSSSPLSMHVRWHSLMAAAAALRQPRPRAHTICRNRKHSTPHKKTAMQSIVVLCRLVSWRGGILTPHVEPAPLCYKPCRALRGERRKKTTNERSHFSLRVIDDLRSWVSALSRSLLGRAYPTLLMQAYHPQMQASLAAVLLTCFAMARGRCPTGG